MLKSIFGVVTLTQTGLNIKLISSLKENNKINLLLTCDKCLLDLKILYDQKCYTVLFFCCVLVVLAEIVPNLGLFISLVGAVSSTALALVFPPLCDLFVRWEEQDYGLFSWRKMVDYLTLVVAVFGFCTGTYFSLQEIVQNFLNSKVK